MDATSKFRRIKRQVRAPRRAARDRGGALRRSRSARDDRPRHRRRRRDPVRQPVSPFRFQGVDGRRDPAPVPRRTLRKIPRDRRGGVGQSRDARSTGRDVVRGHRRLTFGCGDLPGRGQAPRRERALRLPGRAHTEFRDLWVGVLEAGVADGTFRSDIDVELVFRFMRDTVWVAVRWYRRVDPSRRTPSRLNISRSCSTGSPIRPQLQTLLLNQLQELLLHNETRS